MKDKLLTGLLAGVIFGLLASALFSGEEGTSLFSGEEGVLLFFTDLTLAGIVTGLLAGFIKHKAGEHKLYLLFTAFAGAVAFLPSGIMSGKYFDDTFTG
ncbi:MAG: hypothetical protein AB8B69_00485, partial [Chitinophagales bacterium]